MAPLHGPLLPAMAAQASSERETTSESSPSRTAEDIRQEVRRSNDVVDCQTVPQNIVDKSFDYLEEWQHSHERERSQVVGTEPPAGATAPGMNSDELCPYRDSPLQSNLAASGTHHDDGLLLACNRTLSPASEDDLLPAIGRSGTALQQASASSRHSIKRIRHSRDLSRRNLACDPLKHESADVVAVTATGTHYRDAIEATPPERPPSSSSSACSPSVSCMRQPEESSERKRDASEWKEIQEGWPTVWRCPNTPLYSLQRGLLGLLFLTCCAYSMCILSVLSDQFYDPEKGPSRLHDRIHDQVLSSQPFWLATPAVVDVVTVGLLLLTAIRHVFFIPYSIGFLVLYRFFFLLGSMYVLRGLAIVITTVPPSKRHCEPPRMRQASDLFCFSMQQCLNLRRECTGMIISGHSITTCCSMAIWLLYGDAPAVAPLRNMRAACADVGAALHAYWTRRPKIIPLDDTSEITERNRNTEGRKDDAEEPLPQSREEQEAEEEEGKKVAASRKSSAPAAAGVPDICDQIPQPSTDSSQTRQVGAAQGHQTQREGCRSETAEEEKADTCGWRDQMTQRWQVLAHGRDIVLHVVGERNGDQQHQGEGREGSFTKGTTSLENNNEDQEMKEQHKTEARDRRWKENRAGSRGSWSTAVDADGRITRRSADTASVWLNVSDSVNDPPESTMIAVSPAETQRRNSRDLEREQTQQSPLLEQPTSSLCWQRHCGWLSWQRLRQKFWTPSLLRLVCLCIGCTNLLFIVLSFNHYTVDVFMAINFTLGGWSFYHLIVALLWNERLTKKCFYSSSTTGSACQQQQLRRRPAAVWSGSQKKTEKEEIEEMEARDVTGSSERDAVVEVIQAEQEERGRTSFRCGSGGQCMCHKKKEQCIRPQADHVRHSCSNNSSACYWYNDKSGETSGRKTDDENKDIITDTSQDHGGSSSEMRGCRSPSPTMGRDKENCHNATGEDWLLDIKAATSHESKHSPAHKDCDVREASYVERIDEKVRDECFTERESSYYINHSEDAALSSSGGAVLLGRKDHIPSHTQFIGKRGTPPSCGAAGSKRSSTINSFTSESNTFVDAATCRVMRGSWKTLHLPLLEPVIIAVRRLEGM